MCRVDSCVEAAKLLVAMSRNKIDNAYFVIMSQ